MSKPTTKTLTSKDINNIKGYAEEYVNDADAGKNVEDHGEDNKEYLFEVVMEAFYGKDIWKRVSTRVNKGYWP